MDRRSEEQDKFSKTAGEQDPMFEHALDFNRIADASAYLIGRAHAEGLDQLLGKTKLFKMLFMSSWWSLESGLDPIVDGPWYRIQRGPALRANDWDFLGYCLESKHDVVVQERVMPHGHPQFCFSVPRRDAQALDKLPYREHLDRAFEAMIHLTTDGAAAVTYETEAMKWLVAEERTMSGGEVQFREFSLRDSERDRFVGLARKYESGDLDLPEIAREMGQDWDNHRVAIYLDTFGLARPVDRQVLDDAQRASLLEKIAGSTTSDQADASVEARVLASERIEAIFIGPDQLID